MNAGEGNGKPLLNNTPGLGNPSHQESNQTRRTTTTTARLMWLILETSGVLL
jgi:hypothetical protein